MPINWITAFKLIPWSDVIEATPKLVRGARQLWDRTQRREAPEPLPGVEMGDAERLAALERRVQELQEELRSSTQLLEQLAEHNARLVDAVAKLRVRTRVLLFLAIGAAAVAGVALVRVTG
ncbi:MAG TPA: hypothetical protein VNO84_05195 [Burkholderiaceae bacterium]|nr:hypothetical protein [Burkholderiaceae bacterium]